MRDARRGNVTRRSLVGLFGLAALAMAVCGYWSYAQQSGAIRAAKVDDLKAIASLKIGQIVSWRNERLTDARTNSSGIIRKDVVEYIRAPDNPSSRAALLDRLNLFRQNEGYENVLLATPDGRLIASSLSGRGELEAEARKLVAEAVTSGQPLLGDLFRSANTKRIYIDATAPIFDEANRPVAVLVLRSDPSKLLYPLVQSWPLPSRSAETLLLRREGENALFLNVLHHRVDPALTIRMPLTRTEVPAVQAVLGRTGIFEGRDYRGVKVLSDLQPVPGTQWFMVAKIDADEIFAEARVRAWVIALLVLLGITVAGSTALLLFHYRMRNLYRSLYSAEQGKRRAQEEIRATFYGIGDGVISTDMHGKVTRVNPIAETLTGWTESEALGRSMTEVFHIVNEETRAEVENPMVRVLRENCVVGLANHTVLIARDGTERPIADSGAPIRDEKGRAIGVVLVFRDQSEERAAQAAVQAERDKLGAIMASSPVALMVVGENDEIEDANPAAERMFHKRLSELASRRCGELLGCVNRHGDPEGCGHTPHCPACPLLGGIRGVLSGGPRIESREMETVLQLGNGPQRVWLSFSVEPVILNNRRHAIVAMHDLTQRRQAEESLRNSESRLVKAQAVAHVGNWEIDLEARTMWASEEAYGIYGLERVVQSLPLNEVQKIPISEDRPRLDEALRALVEEQKPYNLEFRIQRANDGALRVVHTVAHLAYDTAGIPSKVVGVMQDITERKQAEEAVRESEERFRSLFENNRAIMLLINPEGGAVIEANPAAAAFYGWTREELMARSIYDINMMTPEQIHDEMRRAQEAKRGYFIFKHRLASGAVRDVAVYSNPVRIGEQDLLHSIVFDITERKQAEEALRKNREMLRHILDTVPQAIFWKDLNKTYLGCNRVFAESVALMKPDEIIGKTDFDLPWPASEAEAFRADDQAVMESVRPKIHIIEEVHKSDGSYAVVDTTKLPLLDEHGKVYGVLGVSEDITERKRAEEALQQSEERLRLALEASSDAFYDRNLETGVCVNSPRWGEITGFPMDLLNVVLPYKRDEDTSGLVRSEDVASMHRAYRDHLEGRHPINVAEYRLACASGEEKWILDRSKIIEWTDDGRPRRIIGTHSDITERKRMEEALRIVAETSASSSEDIFRFLVREIAVSQQVRYALLIGTDENDPSVAHNLAMWNNGEFHDRFTYPLTGSPSEQVLVDGTCFFPRNVRNLFPKCAPLEQVSAESYLGTALRDGEGNVMGVLALIDDRPMQDSPHTLSLLHTFAARAAAEMERRRSEEKYQTLFREMLDGFAIHEIICDEAGVPVDYRFLAANPAFEHMTGLSAEKIIGKTVLEVLPGTEPYWIETYGRVALTGQPIHFENYTEILQRHFEVTAFSPRKNQFACIFVDVTERKQAEQARAKMEEQLRQAQKMESVGRLAGGVAHDFNNMLGVILGHAEMAMGQVDSASTLHEDLEQIQKAAQRSADLTRQLLAFARRQTISPRVLNLNDTVTDMLKMLKRLIGEEIELVWRPGAELWSVKMDPSQIDQILANLSVNARDAITGMGRLTIETMNVVLDDAYCRAHDGFVSGEYVLLAVSDNGQGMDKATIEHLFEPFFTTREVGKGTGLGLATVYGAVKQNHGFINVYSEPGVGTTFKIYLPRTEAREKALAATEEKPVRGTETVLLAEDEEPILRLAEAILRKNGYTVLSARTPDEALDLARQHEGTIHLLITDVVMPGMNGRSLRDKLAALRPDLRALFMSGYTADVIANHGVVDEGVEFLQKPFSVQTLLQKVREMLG